MVDLQYLTKSTLVLRDKLGAAVGNYGVGEAKVTIAVDYVYFCEVFYSRCFSIRYRNYFLAKSVDKYYDYIIPFVVFRHIL